MALGSRVYPALEAAEMLAGMSDAAQGAIVELVRQCGGEQEDLRQWCVAALEGVGAPAANQIDELALLASSANSDVAFWAATLLGRLQSKAADAVPSLATAVANHPHAAVQERAT